MKRLPAAALSLLLLVLVTAAATWFTSPRVIRHLLEQQATRAGLELRLEQVGRLRWGSISCGMLELSTTSTPSWNLSLDNVRLTWSTSLSPATALKQFQEGSLLVETVIEAGQATLHLPDRNLKLSDSGSELSAAIMLQRSADEGWKAVPQQLDYAITDASLDINTLHLGGISYPFSFCRDNDWKQQTAPLGISSIASNDAPLPARNFSAQIALSPELLGSELITLERCSVDLMEWKASTPALTYDNTASTAIFTLHLDDISLNEPGVTGTFSGYLPLTVTPKGITLRQGSLKSAPGSELFVRSSDGHPLATLHPAGRGTETLQDINAEIRFEGPLDRLTSLRVTDASTRLFDGNVGITNGIYQLDEKRTVLPLTLQNIQLNDVIELEGDFSASFNLPVSGTLPLVISERGLGIEAAELASPGIALITHHPEPDSTRAASTDLFTTAALPVSYTLSSPSVLLDRSPTGKITIDFRLSEFVREKGRDKQLLQEPGGKLTLFADPGEPAVITLEHFRAGFLGGSIGIETVEYNISRHQAQFVLQLDNVPLQKLLSLQGVNKVLASGSVRGTLPVSIDGPVFEIHQGAMSAAQNGTITYQTSEEEMSAAHQGLQTTYTALSDFRYNTLQAAIDIAPDGESFIALQLKGHNPEFQDGREVHLNINVEQNLLDLLRSLTISGAVEQAITEKAQQQ
ncbi:hypothetical protein CR163_000790 [Prosthecochloris sp. ZM_2]|uniref:intermembrane phospholipid transport protein YdbH family protein n=1 Tax=Prosthecochloris sp. ZM_2 TaxID=2045206 RepID=UPI000DF84BA2|nr:YdbH domain-containing protein [Prosthecochloris sp. ZM_2]RNA66108.1 hypothetical protein CR163_000790 [Prosthecochloris sp. ZM_2]